jgi:hypothetical protein
MNQNLFFIFCPTAQRDWFGTKSVQTGRRFPFGSTGKVLLK